MNEMGIKLEKVTASQVNISLQTPDDEESFKTRKSRRMKFDEYHNRILAIHRQAVLSRKNRQKLKCTFLNTSIKTEVPGEDWTVGHHECHQQHQGTYEKTFRYWANREVHKICPPLKRRTESRSGKEDRQTLLL